MPGVTEQEIAQAKQMNLYQYMQLCEPDNFKPEGPGQFRHKGHSSLTFAEDGSWTYFKTKATGRTALNYLIAVEGVSFVEAVREINRIQGGVRPSFQPVKTPPPPAEKKTAKEFRLPKPDKNNYAATAYLRKRCIHPNVLTFCKQKRILYQTSFKDHPNCVFVGRDGNGEPKGGSLRGCSQIQFRRDIPGSKKIYPFYIEAAATADTVEVYEAPIDAMSGASLKIIQHTGNWRGVHYLALGGTDYAALDAFLTYYPNITHIVLCLDNDEAGRTRTQDIIKHLDGSDKTVEDRPPPIGKDYNDTLVQVTQLKSQFLRDFCQLVLNSKELSAQECSLVDRAALITYQKYLLHPEREQMPSLHDFYNNLSLQGPQAKALTMALSMYVDGTMDLFAHQTNVDLQNHCICFNTVKLGKSMQSIGMMTVLDQIWNRITRNRVLGRRTWIFTDEFQLLLGNSACTNYYFELSSRARKWGAILTSITQHVRSVLNNEDARRMLSDCGYIKLLNQAPDDANDIARLLHISDEEKRYIENAEVGSGLLIADKVVVPFNNTFPQDTELFRLMDTNPNRKK